MKRLSIDEYLTIAKRTTDISSTEEMVGLFLGTNYQIYFTTELIIRLKDEIIEKVKTQNASY